MSKDTGDTRLQQESIKHTKKHLRRCSRDVHGDFTRRGSRSQVFCRNIQNLEFHNIRKIALAIESLLSETAGLEPATLLAKRLRPGISL